MTDIHRILGSATIALALALLLATVASAVLGTRMSATVRGWTVDGLAIVVELLVIVAAALGPLMLAGGSRPADPLHLVYAVIAALALPLALAIAMDRGATGAARDRWLALGTLVLVGVSFRLLQTG
jgi:hypothetical protein